MSSPPSTYPIKGIFYFFSNLSLIRRIICVLFLTLIVAILFLFLAFIFILPLQANGLIDVGCPEWLAWTVSVIFCLLEAVVSTIIFYLIVTPIWQDALFDDVLRLKGLGHVLEKRTSDVGCLSFCSGLTTTFVSVLVQWTVNQSLKFAWKNRPEYISFGFIAVALELIPVANFILVWTNVVGAALWTADVILEEQSDNLVADRAGSSAAYQEANRMDGSTNNKYGSTDNT
ncbi:19759_t:CDS:2 [Funneliformis geosporum]|uniref:8269_t:CDS:1 n=1 Tax=Funneliformis geosporum TaxID=1117311 RepID=A0A9W4WR72_9GLOM|nr:8269_t:CDS:2 [Funneliformis geosporum]CAI2173933.1 19759_t:CDS:2 [Funneliformis geosporum]